MRRRLADEGTSFRAIVDQLRYATALQFLSTSLVTCTDVALLLGYSDSSAFSRSFQRWSGRSPNQWRAAQMIAAAFSQNGDRPVGSGVR
jgi:AraC-like DNA-binding protein